MDLVSSGLVKQLTASKTQASLMRIDFRRPMVMGILNVTPDSFADGGRYLTHDRALHHAEAMTAAGAAIIDVGGESSRPDASPVSMQEEVDRVIPVITAIRQEFAVPISIDTCKAEVMQEAIKAGATLINDINALQSPDALAIAAKAQIPVCLMHMQGSPSTMQKNPSYTDVVIEVKQFLQQRIQACLDAGIEQNHIIIDPGFGFGKTLAHNLHLLRNLAEFTALGFPVLVGVSRKTMLGQILNAPVNERLAGSIALALWAAQKGVKIIRTHDVKATVDALTTLTAVLEYDETAIS